MSALCVLLVVLQSYIVWAQFYNRRKPSLLNPNIFNSLLLVGRDGKTCVYQDLLGGPLAMTQLHSIKTAYAARLIGDQAVTRDYLITRFPMYVKLIIELKPFGPQVFSYAEVFAVILEVLQHIIDLGDADVMRRNSLNTPVFDGSVL